MTAPLLVLDHLAGPIARLGIDYPRFRALLALELTLDERRQHGWVQGSRRVSPLTWSLVVHGAMGCWLAALPSVVASPLTALTLGFTVVMAMLAFDLIADYSALLLDPGEAALLAARPVPPRTVFAARLVHVGIYLALYVGALAAGTAVAGTLRWGRGFLPAYLASLAGSVVLVLASVGIVYVALMRVVGRERLRDATLWAQLVMTVLTVGAYYLTAATNLETGLGLETRWWLPLYPPAWMAGLPALATGRTDGITIALAAAGLVAPWGVALVALRLASGFRPDAGAAAAVARPARRGRLAPRLARWTERSAAGRAAFELVWILTARDRQFRTRTYPALLAVVLFVAAFAIAAHAGVWRDRFGDLAATNAHLLLLYYGILVIPTPILMVAYADHPEAAWIHRGLPFDGPGPILLAGLRVLFIRFVVPVFGCIAALVLALWGRRAAADVALAFAATGLVTVVFALVTGRRVPFSAPPPGGASATTVSAVFGGMLVVVALGTSHWLLRRLDGPLPQPGPVLAAIPVVLGATALLARACRRTAWEDRRA